jgi:hypothetical protein
MKCVGSENPPCARCAKAGRDCVVQQSDRRQPSVNPTPAGQIHRERSTEVYSISPNTNQSYRTVDNPPAVSANGDTRPHNRGPASTSSPANSGVPQLNQSVLQSIYSAPPYSAVLEHRDPAIPDGNVQDVGSQSGLKRRRTTQGLHQNEAGDTGAYQPISERDMVQFIDL